MNETYTTIAKSATYEFDERRSEFIGHVCHTTSEEEAQAFIGKIQSEYRDATHNVWAYHMKNGIIARYSDDGEPQGTAGMPVLEAIRKSGVDDVCVVVTRYFGGVLLGAGGLVRAYAKAASGVISEAGLKTYENYTVFSFVCSYSDYQKILPEFTKYDVKTDNTGYGENIEVEGALPQRNFEAFSERVSELTAARTSVTATGNRFDCP